MTLLERPSCQLAILSGVLVGISYLPIKLGFCIYFGFIPILHSWIINNSKSKKKVSKKEIPLKIQKPTNLKRELIKKIKT